MTSLNLALDLHKEVEEKFTKFLNESSSDADAEAFLKKARDFEKKLREIKSNAVDGVQKTITLTELGEHPYNLPEIVELLQEEPFQYPEKTNVTLDNDRYFQQLKKLWEESDLVEIRNYLVMKLMLEIDYFVEPTESVNELQSICFDRIKSNTLFHPAITALYIEENYDTFKNEIHETAEIAEKIRAEVTLQITNIDWMDDKTKEEANEKMRRMVTHIGFYRKELTNSSLVDKIYEELQVSDQFFLHNWRSYIHFKKAKKKCKFFGEGCSGFLVACTESMTRSVHRI